MDLPAILSTLEISPQTLRVPPNLSLAQSVSYRAALLDEAKVNYRRLSMKHHPDKGGDIEAMQQLNTAYEEIQKIRIVPQRPPVVRIVIVISSFGMSVDSGTGTDTTPGWTF